MQQAHSTSGSTLKARELPGALVSLLTGRAGRFCAQSR